MEAASLTIMVFVLTMAAMKIRSPDWVLLCLQVLSGMLTFMSAFVGLQQAYRTLRRRKAR